VAQLSGADIEEPMLVTIGRAAAVANAWVTTDMIQECNTELAKKKPMLFGGLDLPHGHVSSTEFRYSKGAKFFSDKQSPQTISI